MDDVIGLISQEAAEMELDEDVEYVVKVINVICKYDGTVFGGDGLVCMFLTEGGVRRGTERFLQQLKSLNRREFTICCRMSVQASTFFKRDFNRSIISESSTTPTFSLCTPFGVEMTIGLNHYRHNELFLTTFDLMTLSRNGYFVRKLGDLHARLPNPFMTLYRSIEQRRYRWIETAREAFSVSAGSRQFMHMRWSTLLKEGMYNSDHRWKLMQGSSLAAFLCSGGSCCLCLGEENDPLLKQRLQKHEEESDPESESPTKTQTEEPTKTQKEEALKVWLTTTKEGQRVCKQFLCLPCSKEHVFHVQCFSRLQMNTDGDVPCPLCRAPYSIFEL